MISRVGTGITDSFTYDIFGRLTSASVGNNRVEYEYDYRGLRTSKIVNNERTEYILSGDNVLGESKNGAYQYYYRGMGLIGYTDYIGNNYVYKKNAHGDISATVDMFGNTVHEYTYDAYGNEDIDYGMYRYGGKITPAITDTNPYRYAGEYYDLETGFIYLRARYYDPTLGRFISEDPICDGINWYSYCAGDPVNFVDPWGKDAELDEYVENNYSGKVTVTIAAERPVENSRIVIDLDTFDVGHTFVRIDYGDGRVIYRGFYPLDPLSDKQIVTKSNVEGVIYDDAEHDWNAAVTYEITAEQADKMITFIDGYKRDYNMVTNNCTTFGVQVLAAGGVSAPTSKHKWKLPSDTKQIVANQLPVGKLIGGVIADFLIDGLEGYSPADAVQDFKNETKYVLKYGDNMHIGENNEEIHEDTSSEKKK